MYNIKAYSAASAASPLASDRILRRETTEHDVQIEILFCGICHSDLHTVRNEWSSIMPTVYPCVPGHEIVGRVTKVGSAVSKFKSGDLAGVGCLVDSDHTCPNCKAGLEQLCPNQTLTFNSPDKHLGGVTYGGYSESIVVDEHFVLRVPSNLNLAGVAPLLCAGITTYSPMRRWGNLKARRSEWSASVVWVTWVSNLPWPSAPASLSSQPLPARKRMRFAWVPMRSLFPATLTRCRNMLGVSTLSSTPSPPIMTLMPTLTCLAMTATSLWLALLRNRLPFQPSLCCSDAAVSRARSSAASLKPRRCLIFR